MKGKDENNSLRILTDSSEFRVNPKTWSGAEVYKIHLDLNLADIDYHAEKCSKNVDSKKYLVAKIGVDTSGLCL